MNILFMCVANSARSQLAEGLAKKMFPEAKVESAGSMPSHLNPFAIQVMHEIGIDISQHYSKSTDNLKLPFLASLDFIITLCAEEVCPNLASVRAKKLHWPLPDPASKKALPDEVILSRFRQARDSIQALLTEFKKDLQS